MSERKGSTISMSVNAQLRLTLYLSEEFGPRYPFYLFAVEGEDGVWTDGVNLNLFVEQARQLRTALDQLLAMVEDKE